MASGANPKGIDLSTGLLRNKFPRRALSLRALAEFYEKQYFVVFVRLISPRLLTRDDVKTPEDILRLAGDSDGQPTNEEVESCRTKLRENNLLLKMVTGDRRHGVLIGSSAQLLETQCLPLNPEFIAAIQRTTQADGRINSQVKPQDARTPADQAKGGLDTIAKGIIAEGSFLLMALGASVASSNAAAAAAATGASVIVLSPLTIGAIVAGVSFGVGIYIGLGVWDLMEAYEKGQGAPVLPSKKTTTVRVVKEWPADEPEPGDDEDEAEPKEPAAFGVGEPISGLDDKSLIDKIGDGAEQWGEKALETIDGGVASSFGKQGGGTSEETGDGNSSPGKNTGIGWEVG